MSLYPTPTRKALLRAIEAGDGRIYREDGQVIDGLRAVKVTAAADRMLSAGWIRFKTADEPLLPGEWSRKRKYYRLTPAGRSYIPDSTEGQR